MHPWEQPPPSPGIWGLGQRIATPPPPPPPHIRGLSAGKMTSGPFEEESNYSAVSLYYKAILRDTRGFIVQQVFDASPALGTWHMGCFIHFHPLSPLPPHSFRSFGGMVSFPDLSIGDPQPQPPMPRGWGPVPLGNGLLLWATMGQVCFTAISSNRACPTVFIALSSV